MEHNKIHHYRLNEDADPDFVQRNLEIVHKMPLPTIVKYVFVPTNMFTWKWFYYASNTLKLCYAAHPKAPSKVEFDKPVTLLELTVGVITGSPWYLALAADFIFR